MQQALIATAGLLLAGAITPGPNNFVVMREAARAGWGGALPAIAGVVLGSLALLLLASAGLGVAVAAEPRLAAAVSVAGSVYLAGLGVRLAAARPEAGKERAAEPPALLAGVWGLLAFQFLNPKSWLLVLTVTASAYSGGGLDRGLLPLAALFVLVPAVCLGLWSWAGVALTRWLRRPALRTRVDRAMGGLLVASAVLLLLETWR